MPNINYQKLGERWQCKTREKKRNNKVKIEKNDNEKSKRNEYKKKKH